MGSRYNRLERNSWKRLLRMGSMALFLVYLLLLVPPGSGYGQDSVSSQEKVNNKAEVNNGLKRTFFPVGLYGAVIDELQQMVTIEAEGEPRKEVLKEIARQGNLGIALNDDHPLMSALITVSLQRASIAEGLTRVLADTEYEAAISKRREIVLLQRKAVSEDMMLESSGQPVQQSQQGRGTIFGEVSESGTGESLPGANVVVQGTTIGVATDADGRYTLRGVPAGTVSLEFRFIGHVTQQVDVEVSDEERVEVNVELENDFIEGDEIYVEALQRGQSRALTRQRESVNIRSVVSAEQIDRFADVTVEGALQRIAGMGHGGTNIRGIGSGAANVTMDGQRMGSTEADRRVDLGTISADMVQELEVIKVITPDMDADALSGTININTRRPVGGERTMNVRVGGGWNTRFVNQVGPSTRLSFSYGDSPRDYFSYGVNLSYQRSTPASESVNTSWGTRNFEHIEGPSDVLSGIRNQISFDPRDRIAGGVQFTLQPTDRSTFHVMTNINFQQRAQEQHQMSWSIRTEHLINPYETYNREQLGRSGSADYTSNLNRRDIYQYTARVGARHLFDGFDMEYTLGWGHGRSVANEYRTGFSSGDWYSYLISYDEGEDQPTLSFKQRGLRTDFPKLDYMFKTDIDRIDLSHHRNNDFTGALGVEVPLSVGSLKFGSSALMAFSNGWEERFNLEYAALSSETLESFDRHGGNGFRVLDRTHPTYLIPFIVDVHKMREMVRLNRHYYTLDRPTWAASAETDYFDTQEHTFAGYGMGTVNLGRFRLLGGARVEHTMSRYAGRAGTINTQGRFQGAVDTVANNNYTNIFPNAQVVYGLSRLTNIRLAYSRSIGRPKLRELSPYVLWNHENQRINQGNPDLKPMLSNNLDLLFEHYFMNVGQFTVGLFYKMMENFIYSYTERLPPDGVDGEGTYGLWRLSTFLNGEEATVYGAEVSWQQHLEFLPGFLGNFATYANYSYAWSEADVDRPNQSVRLQDQRPHVVNAGIDYSQGRFSSQISYAWAAPSISSYGELGFAPRVHGETKRVYLDSYRDAANDLSMTVRYRLTSAFRLWADATNILNHKSVSYTYDSEAYPNTQSLSGRTISLGLRYTF